MNHTFQSLAHSDTCYVVGGMLEVNHRGAFGYKMGRFKTYGDGNVQHSPLVAVADDTAEILDAVESLAYGLATSAEAFDLYGIMPRFNVADVSFAYSVPGINGGGEVYYSRDLKKTSKRGALANDRRWEKASALPQESFPRFFVALTGGNAWNRGESICAAFLARLILGDVAGHWFSYEEISEYFGMNASHDTLYCFHWAIQTLQYAREMQDRKNSLSAYAENINRRKNEKK